MDYILELIKEYHKNHSKPQGVLDDIHRAIESSIELRNKKDLIEKFIASLGVSSSVEKNWHIFVEKEKKEELEKIIQEENLKSEETYKFVEASFKNGEIH